LIAAFRASPRYRVWAPATKRHADRTMDNWRLLYGRQQVSSLALSDILLLRDGMSETPGAANNWLKIMGHLLKYAKRTGFIDVNPLADGLEKLPPNRPGGFRTWREDEIEAYRAHWPVGSTARLAFELALNTGAAPVDLVKLGWMNVQRDAGDAFRGLRDGGGDPAAGGSRDHRALARIRYRRQKTERRKGTEETPLVDIPILPELAEVLPPPDGRPFVDRHPVGLGNSMRRWTAAAGLGEADAKGRHLTIHGLRKALGRRLAEAGASVHEIASVLGHETIASVQVYTRAYDRAKAADAALERLAGAKPSNVTRIKRTKE
jgi:integrase/recombinase XerD